MYASSAEAKANGWHSRRHETRDEQDASRERYQSNAKPKARIARRAKRAAKAAKLDS